MRRFRQALPLIALAAVAGCIIPAPNWKDTLSAMARADLPVMGWDQRPEASVWTLATLTAVAEEDAVLAGQVPGDIAAFCPAHPDAPLQDRRAFWAGLLSAVAEYESGWNPAASGGGGRYVGLMQISPRSAAHHGCAATRAEALQDGAANLACAVTIAAAQVGRDGLIAGTGSQGLARDWGPLKREAKRAAIAEWTAAQDYCG